MLNNLCTIIYLHNLTCHFYVLININITISHIARNFPDENQQMQILYIIRNIFIGHVIHILIF